MHAFSFIGAGVISLFYESMQRRFGSVGIHVAFGPISRGKSNATKIALAACCSYPKGYTSDLSDSLARLQGAIPFVYDDHSNEKLIKDLLMNAFGGAEMGTSRGQSAARCAPIVTANNFVVKDLSQDNEWSCKCT